MNKLLLLILFLIPSICFGDSKISQLAQDTSPVGMDYAPILKTADTNNYKVTLSDLKTYINSTYSSITQDANGNIGINTINPQSNLEVKQTGTTNPLNVVNSSSTPLLTVVNGGNVGIGSPNPQQILDVQGSGYINGNLGVGTANPTALNVNYLMGLYGNSNAAKTIFVDNPSSGTSAQARFELKTYDTGGEFIQYPTTYQIPSWAGRSTFYNETGNGVSIITSGGSTDFDNSTSINMRFTGAGNLGIGTITPTRKLQVSSSDSGTTTTSASTSAVGILNSNTTNNTFSDMAMSTLDSSGAEILSSKISGQTTNHTAGSVSGDLLFINKNAGTTQQNMVIKSSGNVGIGSPNPQQTLDLQGNAFINGNVGIGTANPTAINVNYLAGLYGNVNGARTIFVDNPNSGTSAQVRFELKTYDTGGEFIQYPTTYQIPAWAGRSTFYNETGNGISLITNGGSIDFDNSISPLMLLNTNSGNLGIGTTTPIMKLDVRGTIRGTAFFSSDGSPGVTGSTCSAWKNGLCTSA